MKKKRKQDPELLWWMILEPLYWIPGIIPPVVFQALSEDLMWVYWGAVGSGVLLMILTSVHYRRTIRKKTIMEKGFYFLIWLSYLLGLIVFPMWLELPVSGIMILFLSLTLFVLVFALTLNYVDEHA